MSFQSEPVDTSKRLLAALAYPIWVVALIIILTDLKKDPFLRHHGWHALFWAAGWLIIYAAWTVAAELKHFHWLLFIYPALWTAFVVLSLYYAVQAYNAKETSIPVVSRLTHKYRR